MSRATPWTPAEDACLHALAQYGHIHLPSALTALQSLGSARTGSAARQRAVLLGYTADERSAWSAAETDIVRRALRADPATPLQDLRSILRAAGHERDVRTIARHLQECQCAGHGARTDHAREDWLIARAIGKTFPAWARRVASARGAAA